MKIAKIITCERCKRQILPSENFCHLEEWDKKNKLEEWFWHKLCWDEVMQPKRLAMNLVARTHKLLQRAEEIAA